MARKGNQTCVQLHNVAKTGLAHHSSSLVVKGTWYPQHFSLAVTDGVNAWKIDATESFVIQRANDLKVTAAQYVDKAHLHLGHGHRSSLYSLHCLGSNPGSGAQLLCTPRDGRDHLNVELTLNLPLKVAPVLDLAFEMVEFLMHANQELEEKLERKSRTYERTKATIEQSVEDLQCQKAQLQYEKSRLEMEVRSIKDSSELKLGEETELAIVPVPTEPSSGLLKRKFESVGVNDDPATKRGSSWKGRPPWAPLPPPPPTPMPTPAAAPSVVVAADGGGRPPTENGRQQSPPKEELSGCEGEWKNNNNNAGGGGRSNNTKAPTTHHKDGSLDVLCKPSNAPTHALPKGLTGKKRGRKPKGTVVQAPDAEARLPLVRAVGGPHALTRDQLSEHRIEEQSERAIKLLEPYTRQLVNPRAIGKSALAPKVAGPKTAGGGEGRKRGTAAAAERRKLHLRQPSEDTSTQSSVALPLVVLSARERAAGVPAAAADAPTPALTKEFNVINADFYDFDNERSKYVMGLGQYWALYDNQDGMPRFYGRIVSLVLEPFQVDVEWLEPYRPVLAFAGLVKTAGLSVACGEFKRDTIGAQTLAAFSHRMDVEADAKRKTYHIYPRKGEVWALYKHWDKPLGKQQQFANHDGDGDGDDGPKFEYELVELLSDYSKERGVKVGPISKVPGFKTVFRSGGFLPPHWIPGKDLQAMLSHQIATHRFDGSETRVVPRGSFGLDSASTPEEFLSTSPRVIDTPVLAVEIMQTISESG